MTILASPRSCVQEVKIWYKSSLSDFFPIKSYGGISPSSPFYLWYYYERPSHVLPYSVIQSGSCSRRGSEKVLPASNYLSAPPGGICYKHQILRFWNIRSTSWWEKKLHKSWHFSAITFTVFFIACLCNIESFSGLVIGKLTTEIWMLINKLPNAHQITPTDGKVVDNPQDRYFERVEPKTSSFANNYLQNKPRAC